MARRTLPRPELAELLLAEAFLDADEELDELEDELTRARADALPWEGQDDEPGQAAAKGAAQPADNEALVKAAPAFRATAAAATALVQALGGAAERFFQLDEWFLERAFGPRLLDLPITLALVGETEDALELARAMVFIDRELMQGDIAIILARAGRREEALAQVDVNLTTAEDAPLAEAKAGDAHRALGDLPAAEAYYRRSLQLAVKPADRLHALLRLVGCLTDGGREQEAAELMKQTTAVREPRSAAAPNQPQAGVVRVGRNEPCPCGSGKKYKKCHGA